MAVAADVVAGTTAVTGTAVDTMVVITEDTTVVITKDTTVVVIIGGHSL